MCCIFTCVGWLLDAIQRCWTFTMACCIAGAVVVMVTATCTSGVALGYNYSLAEYIDLKETNVSVYLKRGVFDDEIADDMDWRRAGHLPISGHIAEPTDGDTLFRYSIALSAEDGDEKEHTSTTVRVGRRLDDSIFDSDDHRNFEGSLLRLTAKPLDQAPRNVELEEVIKTEKSLSSEATAAHASLNQVKALQAMVNLRKANISPRPVGIASTTPLSRRRLTVPPELTYPTDDNGNPVPMDNNMFPKSKKGFAAENEIPFNSHRYAVPGGMNSDRLDPRRWYNPRVAPEDRVTDYIFDTNSNEAKFPSPITPRAGPLRPSKPPPPRSTEPPTTKYDYKDYNNYNVFPLEQTGLESMKKKLMLRPGVNSQEFLKTMQGKSDQEDYNEVKGLPRKKRSLNTKHGNAQHIFKSVFKNTNTNGDNGTARNCTNRECDRNMTSEVKVSKTIKTTATSREVTNRIKTIKDLAKMIRIV